MTASRSGGSPGSAAPAPTTFSTSGMRRSGDYAESISASASTARMEAPPLRRASFRVLGNGCEFIADEPDGTNINDNCGTTHIGQLCEYVKNGGMAAGFAFDGDADSCALRSMKTERSSTATV
ncbi:MAG: hypothetical protein ACLSG5_00315 [Oscillospiraceae bacterium]